MMKRACKQSGGVCLVALLLAACGGGGGGGGGLTSPVRALDPAQARTYFTGSTGPGLTAGQASDQVAQRLESIQGSANGSLLVSDISLFTTRDDVSLPSRLNADCTTMTTCGYTISGISVSVGVTDLSFSGESLRPVMRHRGIPLVSTSRSMTRGGGLSTEVSGYGGWLDHSGFLVQGETVTSGDARGISGYYGISAGIASNSRPAGGSARWNGVMVAADVSDAGRENVIQGDTALSIDFGADTVDLSFSNVWDLTAGTTRTGTAWSDMPVTASGTFSGRNAQGETTGRFYGPRHEEAGGTFTYDDLTGAYGLRRQEAVPPPPTTPTTPGLNVRQIHSEIEQLVGRIQGSPVGDIQRMIPGRSMLLSDVSLFTARDDLRLPVRLDTTCQVMACNFELLGGSSTINVNEFSLGSAAALRSVTRERGILLTEGAEAIQVGGEAPSYPGWIDYSRFPVSGEVGEVFGYGGWLDHSGFLVESVPITSGNARGVSLYYGRSIGIASNSWPTPTGGSARWNGVMVATDVSGPGRENVIRGDAALSVDFDAATADLSLSNVRDLTAGTARPGTAWIDMDMPMPPFPAEIPPWTFSGTNAQGETTGRFYGPGHQEAGGTFTYDDLAGAYGLRRQ